MAAGLNYCAIATLSFLGLLQEPPKPVEEVASQASIDTPGCIRWMLDRQTSWIEEDDEDDEDDEEEEDNEEREKASLDLSSIKDDLMNASKIIAGFCGRCGKIADTCYCFWNVGALAVSPSNDTPTSAKIR